MGYLHTGIVLRAPSVHRKTVTLFDEQYGKIQALVGPQVQLSHGSRLTYGIKKGTLHYFLYDVQVLDVPLEWAGEHFMFFHHILELCDYFMPWQVKSSRIFTLMSFLYTQAQAMQSLEQQKQFLQAFFTRVGLYPGREQSGSWLAACLQDHPQVRLLKTAGYLKTLEAYDKSA